MAIIVTGTPATGKTTLAKKLATEKGFEYLDLGEFAKAASAVDGRDEARDADIIDEVKLVAAITAALRKSGTVVIDGHLSQDISPELIEQCYVTRCSLPELKKRLEARGYSAAKVRENMDAEIFNTCGVEAKENGHAVVEVWTG